MPCPADGVDPSGAVFTLDKRAIRAPGQAEAVRMEVRSGRAGGHVANPPGWFSVEGESGGRRWWNGTAWEDGVEQDQRVALDRLTVFGERLRFVTDPTWPSAPMGWFPPPLWEPSSGWRSPAGRLWDVAADDGDLELELTRLEELAQVVDIRVRESEPGAWHVADLDAIPIVWTPPPSWPAVPNGWSPPPGWKAPRAWAPVPAGWNFWQHDPSVLAYRHEILRNDIEERSRVLSSTLTGIASMLNAGDQVLCHAMQLTPLALSPLPTVARAGLGAAPPQHIVFSTQMAQYQLNLAVSNLRTYLLQVAFGTAEAPGWCGCLRRLLNEAREDYRQTIEVAAQAVFDVTIASLQNEVNGLERSRRRDRQARVAWLSSLMEPLQVDATERGRVLNDVAGD